jgi:hypothetical protein
MVRVLARPIIRAVRALTVSGVEPRVAACRGPWASPPVAGWSAVRRDVLFRVLVNGGDGCQNDSELSTPQGDEHLRHRAAQSFYNTLLRRRHGPGCPLVLD